MSNDILPLFTGVLRDAGLEVETVEADGRLHRCRVAGYPRGEAGAYKAHLDAPACIWWMNWLTGDSGTRTTIPEKDMDRAERKALRERIAAAKAEAEKEQAARRAAAAKAAASIWERSVPLPEGRTDAHAYLARKGVYACRRLCALTGEKLRSSAKCCENFRPGKWGERGAAFYPVRQGLVCRACSSGLVPTIRAALLGLVGCMAGHVVAGAAQPFPCADFRARRAADVR